MTACLRMRIKTQQRSYRLYIATYGKRMASNSAALANCPMDCMQDINVLGCNHKARAFNCQLVTE